MSVRNRFDKPVRQQVTTEGPSLTQQHFAHDADANNIMARHLRNVQPGRPPAPIGNPTDRRIAYGVQVSMDYHAALNKVVQARTLFESLPARVRGRFGNDVGAMLAFADDPANREEALKLRLVVPTEQETAAKSKAELAAATKEAVQELTEAFRAALGTSTEAGNPTKADPEAQPSYGTTPQGLMKPRRTPSGD